MKQQIYRSIWLLALFLVACSSPEPTVTPTQLAAATTAPTHTAVPSQTPTDEPTATATAVPTDEPTATSAPTETPTRQPTETPTEKPTSGPRPSATPGAIKTIATAVPATKEAGTESEATAVGPSEFDDIDVMRLLQESDAAQDAIQTLRQQQTMVISTSMFTQTVALDCQRHIPNAHCLMDMNMQIAEMPEPIDVQVELLWLDGEYWARENENTDWEQIPQDQLAAAGITNLEFEFSVDPDMVVNAHILAMETINGVETYKITAEMDVLRYYEVYFAEQSEAGLLTGDEMDFSFTLWVGVDDLITRQMEMEVVNRMDPSMEAHLDSTIINSNFNEPVSLPERPSR